MKQKWIYFVLAPLFSYAGVQEEWLSETTFPVEFIQEKSQNNKETSYREDLPTLSSTQRSRVNRRSPQEKKRTQLDSKEANDVAHTSSLKESQWAGFLERLTLKKVPIKSPGGLNIVTNRKSKTYLNLDENKREELVEKEDDREIPSEKAFSKKREYRYTARDKIQEGRNKREQEISMKKKNALAKKNAARARKEISPQ